MYSPQGGCPVLLYSTVQYSAVHTPPQARRVSSTTTSCWTPWRPPGSSRSSPSTTGIYLRYPALYCTVLHCTALHCTALLQHCIILKYALCTVVQALEDQGGWLSPSAADWFEEFAAVCFQAPLTYNQRFISYSLHFTFASFHLPPPSTSTCSLSPSAICQTLYSPFNHKTSLCITQQTNQLTSRSSAAV